MASLGRAGGGGVRGHGERASISLGQTLGQRIPPARHPVPGSGTDRTASEFPAKAAGNPLAVLSVPGGTVRAVQSAMLFCSGATPGERFERPFSASLLGTWGTQVVLANNGYSGSVTIDAAGNLAVVWYQSPVNEIFAATAAFGHPWSAPVNISGAVSPGAATVLGSTSGNATAIYTTATSTGTYVDHLASGNWGAPGPTNGVNQFHVSNDRGDEGLAWSTGGARPTSSTIDAVVRPAGGTWSLASTVATGVHLAFDGALMLSDGSMAVA